MPTLGGSPRRVASANFVLPSPNGDFIYYSKSEQPGIFRAGKSGVGEEAVYSNNDGLARLFVPLLVFPGGNDILAAGGQIGVSTFHFYRVNVSRHDSVDLGEVEGNHDAVWAEPGETDLFSREVNGLTNIWSYSLKDRSLQQITFGTGPDFAPMPDPGGKGLYYVNGKSAGSLTAYHIHSKESTDIVSEDATQPTVRRMESE